MLSKQHRVKKINKKIKTRVFIVFKMIFAYKLYHG
jgi:cell division protein FtsB